MNEEEIYSYFETLKVGEQEKIIIKLGKLFNKNFQKAMQKVMYE